MIKSFLKIVLLMALLALLIQAFPIIHIWLVKAIEWLLTDKWGIIFVGACILSALSQPFIEVKY